MRPGPGDHAALVNEARRSHPTERFSRPPWSEEGLENTRKNGWGMPVPVSVSASDSPGRRPKKEGQAVVVA
jgi:hypothetical protein